MDPLKHKETIRKMLLEERRKEERNKFKRRFFRGASEKHSKPFTAEEEMVGIPYERPEKNAQGDDLPWWCK